MKKIVVAGTSSGVGKTAVASFLLSSLSGRTQLHNKKHEKIVQHGRVLQHAGGTFYEAPEHSPDLHPSENLWSALKITIRHEGSCPRHTDCDACDAGYEPFEVITDDTVLMEKGKDTDQLSRAGASKVVWLQSDPSVEAAGIEAALDCFGKDHNLVIEGNSFLRVKSADVAILVVSPLVDKIKRSAKLLLNKIDFIVINLHKRHTIKEIEACKEKMVAFGFDVPFYAVNPRLSTNYSNQVLIEKIQSMLFKT
jgi:molybdopterin-guanine dinucleotide biosynthesis protein